jgi:glycine/D-amino acid oxidase-like deaminating enzyme
MPVPDLVVVGAGIIGAAIARRAAERGARVTVVEANRPAGGTSLATFSWVNAVGKQPRAYFDLNFAGIAEHRRLMDELGDATWYHPGGNLEWSGAADALRERVERHAAWGYAVQLVDPGEARRLEPGIHLADGAAVAFYPEDGWVDPVVLVGRLLEHEAVILASGTAVARILTRSGRAAGVELADGARIAAADVVVATGPSAAELLEPLGFILPMRHAPGLLAFTEPAATGVGRILHAPGVAIRPDGSGRLLLAADDLDKRLEPSGGDLPVPDATAQLLDRARRAVPALAGVPVEATRIGLRALTADGFPAVGPVPGTEGAYVAVTHSGVTLAPLLGRLVAGEVLGGTREPTLADYRPDRFVAAPGINPSS